MAGLISLNELKTYLRVAVAETSLDAVLQPVIDASTAEWEQDTGRTALYTSYVNEIYQGNFARSLAIKNAPIDIAATFQVIRIDQFGQPVALDPSDYTLDATNGIVTLTGSMRFPSQPNSTEITYSAGWKVIDAGVPPTLAPSDQRLAAPANLRRNVLDWCGATYRKQVGALSPENAEKIIAAATKSWYAYANLW